MPLHKFEISYGAGLKLGFATVLILMFALIVVAIVWMARIDSHLESIVKINLVKVRLATEMQTALRERAVSMHSIAAMDDPFEKDREYQYFNALGTDYMRARQALSELPLSAAEQTALEDLRKITSPSRELVAAVIEKAVEASSPEQQLAALEQVRISAVPTQKRIATQIDRLVKIQETAIQASAKRARASSAEARRIIIMLGAIASLLGSLVAFLSIRNATGQANKLQHQAMFDDLTDLPNRVLFQDRLQQTILVSRRENQSFALVSFDLNRFKEVNDTLGHHSGDLLLQQVAKRLTEMARESDTIARMGGDEFSVLLPTTNTLGSQVFAKKIMDALESSFDINGKQIEIGASIGIAVFPTHGSEFETLMRHADAAMYVAKRARSGFEMYDSQKSPDDDTDTMVRSELRQAIEQDHLVLYFQPKISHETSKVSGLEALVRWQHPTRGLIPPDQFIPLAEQSGLIRPLTAWVLEHAVAQCAQLQHLGMPLTMAVNLSTINLKDPELPNKIATVLKKHKLEAKWLELEITESAVMDDTMRTVQVLAELDILGARISIDDYGTGYSSLSYFKKLPLDDIKIDKSFVIGMSDNHEDATIVRSTIEMGHELGLRVVAEGVEDLATWDILSKLGCDAAQGYYMSRPLAAGDLLKWLCESPWGYQSSYVTDSTSK